MRARCEREPHLLQNGSAFVLYALMDAVVDRYFPVLDALADELERIEDEIFGRGLGRRNVEALYGMNFKNIPELEWAYGYPMALAVMAILDGWLFWRFKKARWI